MYKNGWLSESRIRESQVACSQTGAMELHVATELFISMCDVLKEDVSGRDCFSIAYLPVQCSKHEKKTAAARINVSPNFRILGGSIEYSTLCQSQSSRDQRPTFEKRSFLNAASYPKTSEGSE